MMENKNILWLLFGGLIMILLSGYQNAIDLPTSKGIKLHVVPDKDALYLHGEILVKYHEPQNLAISYLTYLNLFDRQITGQKSSLLSLLYQMGNDAEIIFNIDHIVIKINFLKSRVQTFIQFLKKLLDSGSFSLKNYKYSVANFKKFFFRNKRWESIIALQIAGNEMFKGKNPSLDFLTDETSLKNINLSQIRSFYKKNFVASSVTVAVKGAVNPYIFLGLVEKAFRNYKNKPVIRSSVKSIVAPERKVVIINTGKEKRYPEIFWFIPVPPVGSDKLTFFSIANNILFGYPFGNVFRIASNSGVKILKLSTSHCDLQNISFICNRIRLARYRDIEKFFFIVNRSFRKFLPGRIGKKEFLSSYNFIYQAEKLALDGFDHIVSRYIKRDLTRYSPLHNIYLDNKEVVKDVNYVSFSNYMEKKVENENFYKKIKRGVIVIFGDSGSILMNIKAKKAGIVNVY